MFITQKKCTQNIYEKRFFSKIISLQNFTLANQYFSKNKDENLSITSDDFYYKNLSLVILLKYCFSKADV
jgi:hypothetical protein